MGREFLVKVVPLVCPYLFANGYDRFEFVENELGSLYATRFVDIWRFWIWMFEKEHPFEAYAAFNTAVLLCLLPVIVKDSLKPQDLDEQWDKWSAELRLPDVLKLAHYLVVAGSPLKVV
jgi:hypothetical protein